MGTILNLNKTPVIMGILNITPDSFSDGGKYLSKVDAISRANDLTQDGAQLIDIGGESSRPGSTTLSAEEELSRIENVVTQLVNKFTLSIDTYKAKTAARCLELGAKIINDISALRAEPDLAKVVSDANAYIILMHSKESDSHPLATRENKDYQNIIQEVAGFLLRRADFAMKAGIAESKIILDPGMGGFLSPDPKYSWQLLEKLEELIEKIKPFPLLIGTSRKGFLGGALEERDPMSQLTALSASLKGASIIRTHQPKMFKQFYDAWKTIYSAGDL